VTRAAGRCDVVVIGGGPAGSAAAHLLASWGWSVCLIHRPSARPTFAESLPPSTRKLLAHVGQLDAVERAAFHPSCGTVARWAGAERTTETDAPGFHVSRAVFDRVLRGCAASARVRIVDGVVRRVDPGDPARVTYAAATGEIAAVDAPQVLDCSGRAGVVARRGLRRARAGYRTLAIAAEWDCVAWPVEEQARTLVESYADGWAWSAPLSATRRQCTVMIEGGRKDRTFALQAAYEREIGKTTAIRDRLAKSRVVRAVAPWACDASVYDCMRAADDSVLLVGDAASFIEPLSSAGVKKALLSAWRAAIVANTCLKRSPAAAAARDFYSQREREVYADCTRRSGLFFAEAAVAYASPFWFARADAGRAPDRDPASDVGDAWSDAALVEDAGVRAAFESLRTVDGVRLRAADTLRFEPVPAIEGREVVLRDGVVLRGVAGAVPFAAGVDLPALARLARGGVDVATLIAAYHAKVGPAPVSGLLAGLSLLVARRALVAEGTAT